MSIGEMYAELQQLKLRSVAANCDVTDTAIAIMELQRSLIDALSRELYNQSLLPREKQ